MSTTSDLNVFRLAALQEGVFTSIQAEAAGLSPRAIRWRLETGGFVRVVRDVLSVPDWPESSRRSLFVGTLAVPASAASRGSAGHLNEMPLIDEKAPTVTVPKGVWRDLPGLRVHESRLLNPSDITVVGGLRATTPARTLVDVAAEVGWSRFFHVADRCLAADRPELGELIACYASLTRRGRRGAAKVTRYLRERTVPPVYDLSELEWMFEQLLLRFGLRLPIRQYRPPWFDGIRGVADYAVPKVKLIIELDGRSFHSTMQAFREDRRRDRLAREHGWTPIRYTYEEVRYRGEEVIAELRPYLGGAPGAAPMM